MIVIIDRKLSEAEILQVNGFFKTGVSCFSTGNFFDNAKELTVPNNFHEEKLNYFLNFVVNFPHRKFNEKTFNEIYKYNEIKLFYYHKFRVFHNLKESFVFSEFLKSNFNDNEFVIYSDKKQLNDFFPENYKITIYKNKTNYGKTSKYLTFFKYAIFVFIRYFSGLFTRYNLKNVKHIFIENSKPIKLLNKNLNIKDNNVVFPYIYDKLNKDSIIFNVIDIPKFYKDLKFKKYLFVSSRKNVKTFFYEKAFINNFSFKAYKNIKKQINEINNTLTEIINNSQINNCEKAIINNLISLHKTTVFYLIRYESVKRFFAKNNFKTFTATDENGALTKGIVDAAKSAKIKTFGTQHGGIGKYTLSYILSKNDNLHEVIPDKTFVWGKYWKEFLISQGNYPSEKLQIVGQPRTDIIPVIKSKINTEKNIVLYASQPMSDLDYKKRAAVDILNVAKQKPDIKLIIKLHPFEYNGYDYYNKLIIKKNLKNVEISNDDLYLLIAKSKLVVNCFSTVGAEAAYFYKPLIIIDYKHEDLLKYINTKIAFGAYNFSDLNKLTVEIINNNLKPEKKDIDNFINNFAYKIDGKVSDRMLNTIYNG
ncbi:MAG: hypothetical protein DRI94_06405 [Bacteroidetes bacterium]|nr:MAG: hypothetical protein DRI94_06405 [Bacteroidota bacterium]